MSEFIDGLKITITGGYVVAFILMVVGLLLNVISIFIRRFR